LILVNAVDVCPPMVLLDYQRIPWPRLTWI